MENWDDNLREGILADVFKGISTKPTDSQYRATHSYHNYTGKKLFYCETCKKVWENIGQQNLIYTDFPSYGLKRKRCKYCTEEKMHWTCSFCEKQVDEKFFDLDERICDDCNEDKAPIFGEEENDEYAKAWLLEEADAIIPENKKEE